MGTLKLPVPVCRSGEKVSPIPDSAPPPWGREMTWSDVPDLLLIITLPLRSEWVTGRVWQQRYRRKTTLSDI